jgi:hypothetical protein
MYDLAVRNGVATWQPRQLLDADGVVSYAADWFAMADQPAPAFVTDPEFPALLDAAGEYKATVGGDVEISVWRAA